MTDALIIPVDSSQVEKGKRSLADLAAQGKKTEQSIGSLGKTGSNAGSAISGIATNSKAASLGIAALGTGLVGVAGALKAIQAIDSFTKFNAQLKLATRSQEEFLKATTEVSSIAKVAQADISSIGTLYARINNSVRDLGASQKETADITENVALALKVSGATAQETSSAILQLSQAFGSGVLRGEEFNAVNESAPALMRALAESIGVPVGKLKELASNGQITGDVLLKAFGDDKLLENFRTQAKEVQTIAGGWTVFSNQITVAIGKINETTGASKILIGVLEKAATLLSVFEGGEKGSILRNFLDKRPSQKDFSVDSNDSLRDIAKGGRFGGGQALRAQQELDKRLKQAGNIKFGGDLSNKSFAPNFNSAVELANDVKRVEAQEKSESRLSGIKKAAKDATDALRKAEEERKRKLEEHFDILRAGAEAEYAYNESLKEVRNTIFAAVEAEQSRLDSTEREIDVLRIGEKAISDREIAEIRNTIAINESNAAFLTANTLHLENNGYIKAAIDAIGEQNKAYEKLIGTKEKNIEADLRLNSFKLDKEQADNRIKEAERAQKEIEREQEQSAERMGDNLSRALTDGLFNSFKDGESFGKSMLKNLLAFGKTFFAQGLQNILSGLFKGVFSGSGSILGSLGGLFSGGASAGGVAGEVLTGKGGGSIFGQLSSIGDIFSKGNDAIVNGIGSIGQSLSAFGSGGTGFFRDIASSIGSFTQLNSSLISNALPFAGAALQALTGNIKGAAFTAGGAAIGSVIPGIGTAIGGAIGGLVGSLFGGKKKIPRFSTLRAGEYQDGVFTARSNGQQYKPLGAEKNIDGLSEQFARTLGGFLTGFGLSDSISTTSYLYKKRKASYASFGATFEGGTVSAGEKGKAKAVQQTFENLVAKVLGTTIVEAIQQTKVAQGVKDLFAGLTDKTQVVNMINASIALNEAQVELAKKYDLTSDLAGKVSVASGEAGDALASFVNSLAAVGLQSRTAGAQLIKNRDKLSADFNTVFGDVVTEAVLSTVTKQEPITASAPKANGILGALGIGSISSRPATSGIVSGFAGVNGFLNKQVEQFKTVTEQVTTYIDKIVSKNLALPKTLQEYDDLLKAIDKSSASGQKMFADVFALREQFAAIVGTVDTLKGGVKGAQFNILSEAEKQAILDADLAKLFGDLGRTVPASVQELIALGNSIDYTTASGLDLAAAFPSLVDAFTTTKDLTGGLTQSFDDLASSLNSVSTDKFTSLVDYINYQSIGRNYGKDAADAQFFGAGDNVGYASVQTQSDTLFTTLRDSNTNQAVINQAILDEIKLLRQENFALQKSIEKNTADNLALERQREVIGTPPVRAA